MTYIIYEIFYVSHCAACFRSLACITSFNKIGVISVVTITTRTMAGKSESDISPACSPFCATINATSPLEIIPTPMVKESIFENPHIFAPNPQPIILESMATSKSAMVKNISSVDISVTTVLIPMLAKKIGVKNM